MPSDNKNTGKIRIKDIAKRADVSVGTVDRVLHNRGEVKEETRKKVLAIIDEMGYTPNLLAKSLALKKTYRIAAIIPGASDNNPYWEKPLQGVLNGANEIKDFQAVVDVYQFNATDKDSFIKVYKKAIETEPSGIIFNPVFRKISLDFIHLLDDKDIPYVYIDTDLGEGNNLAYFGQKAEQSGKVAAKVMSQALPDNSKILIVKLANKKVISHHLRNREKGFIEFFKQSNHCNCNFVSIDIDLLEENEPAVTLEKVFKQDKDIKGIFVPSSRVFKVAAFIKKINKKELLLLGYDLIKQNVELLKEGVIDVLISQKPEQQGYMSVMALFNYIVLNKKMDKINYSSIDIIIKENIDFYN